MALSICIERDFHSEKQQKFSFHFNWNPVKKDNPEPTQLQTITNIKGTKTNSMMTGFLKKLGNVMAIYKLYQLWKLKSSSALSNLMFQGIN